MRLLLGSFFTSGGSKLHGSINTHSQHATQIDTHKPNLGPMHCA